MQKTSGANKEMQIQRKESRVIIFKKGNGRGVDAVKYLKERFDMESKLRKEEMEFKKCQQQMLMDPQSQMA